MNKLGLKGRAVLKGFHILFGVVWIGAGISMMLLNIFKGLTPNGDELYAVNMCIKIIDDFIIIPCAFGSLISGFLICWLTNWGFFKFSWIIFKWVSTIAQILFGSFALGPWLNGALAIVDAQRAMALQNESYLYFREMNIYLGSLQLILLIIVVFISTFKPWGKRKQIVNTVKEN